MTTSPLPGLDSPRAQELRLSEKSDLHSAYNIILQAEQHAVQQKVEENVVFARVAGYIVLEFHSQSNTLGDAPCATLVNWLALAPGIVSGEHKHDVVFKVGKLCYDEFVPLFRKFNNPYRTFEPYLCRSYPSFDALEDMNKEALESTSNDYATYKKKALARDGYRCIITGLVDDHSVSECAGLQAKLDLTYVSRVAMGTAHILGKSMIQGMDLVDSEDNTVVDENPYPTGAVATLERFGFSGIAEAFKCSGSIHQVWNLLSIERNLHERFDALDLWLESTDKPGRYKICVCYMGDEKFIRRNFVGHDRHIEGAPMVVEFTSQFEQAPPPDPRLLALHATCARVAHMSGAAVLLNRLEWEAEGTGSTASDVLRPFKDH